MPEMTLAGFIEHLARVAVETKVAEHEALEKAALRVERRAKAEIGTYQDGAGPFAGWPELADSTKDDRVKQGYSENDPGYRSGEMGASIGHAVGDEEAVVGSNDDHLVYFELGTDHQPPRSVLGIAAVNEAEAVAEILGASAVKALVGNTVANRLFPIPD
jgi:hypothetical protein